MGLRKLDHGNLDLFIPASQVPYEFGYESEHPAVSLPFSLYVYGQKLDGRKISMTTIDAVSKDDIYLIPGTQHAVKLQFEFENFSISIYPEVIVAGEFKDDLILKFVDPTGDHVAQLRFLLNSYIAGDFVTLGSAMSYSGPIKPKEEKKAVEQKWTDRYRSLLVALCSGLLVLWAASALFTRYTTEYEMHPVLIERAGQPMQATTAGQVSYLNADAKMGEVLFSVNSNSGDILNFKMPCDCKAVIKQGISEGSTVLPNDVISTILVNNFDLRAQALMSVEGLTRTMKGDRAYLEMTDGRSVPVRVIAGSTANSAAMSGELFVPVQLVAEDGALTDADLGGFARLRLTKSYFWN